MGGGAGGAKEQENGGDERGGEDDEEGGGVAGGVMTLWEPPEWMQTIKEHDEDAGHDHGAENGAAGDHHSPTKRGSVFNLEDETKAIAHLYQEKWTAGPQALKTEDAPEGDDATTALGTSKQDQEVPFFLQLGDEPTDFYMETVREVKKVEKKEEKKAAATVSLW